jgi:HEAT repeat protein
MGRKQESKSKSLIDPNRVLHSVCEGRIDEVVELGKDVIPVLFKLLGRKHGEEVNERIRQALNELKKREPKHYKLEYSKLIKKLGEDPNIMSRAYAANILGLIRDPRAIIPLLGAAEHDDERLQKTAIYALGNFKDAKVADALIDKLYDVYVRETAIRALANIGRPAVPALEKAQMSVDPQIREAVTYLLNTL